MHFYSNPSAPEGQAQQPGPLIMLVEDEPVVREVTRQVLELAGYNVLECEGAEQALAIARQHRRNLRLLLSDVIMPGMDGPELARLLQEEYPELITIFMSGYATPDAVHKALGGSRALHLQKPFTVAALLTTVADAMKTGAAQ